MKPFVLWLVLSGAILLAALALRALPASLKGAGFLACMFLVTIGILAKIVRGSP